jgi:Lipase (class 3)
MSTKKMSVLALGEETMAHSLLIFMLADLRILSARGKIHTKYEYLCIDSDKSPRHAATDFAGFHNYTETRGVTAAHIMAVLMLEISQQANSRNENNGDNNQSDENGKLPSILAGSRESIVVTNKKRSPFVFGRKEIEKAYGMPALLHCYNAMLAQDIASDTHMISRADYPMIIEPKRQDGVKKADFIPYVTADDEEGEALFAPGSLFRMKSIRHLEAKPIMNKPNSFKIAGKASKADRKNINLLQNIANIQSAMTHLVSGTSEYYNQDEIFKLLEQAVESRNRKQIEFMKHFFKEGSISRVLVESKSEMVWLSDWHTAHECTYAISIDREEKKVLLAFRGAYTRADWAHILDTKETSTSNPIKEDYPNRPKNIRLHNGFHKYLFRVRKDTETTKYDEIASKVSHYCNVVGEGVTLTITGHSLGAALATVFCLYASTDETFTRNGAIETVTFGAPYVAGFKFADAVRHQESVGKLRIAKFCVADDGVRCLPPTLFSMSKRGAKYFNSGMEIKLPGVRKGIFKLCGQPKPEPVYYGPTKGFIKEWLRQVNDFYFWNIPIRFWLTVKMHTLVEHKLRMALIDKSGDQSQLVKNSLEELYQMQYDDLK